MNKIRTLAHIRTHRMVKSFRACVNMTGKSQILAEFGRIYLEEYKRLNRVILAEFGRIYSEEYKRLNRVQQARGKRILQRSAL